MVLEWSAGSQENGKHRDTRKPLVAVVVCVFRTPTTRGSASQIHRQSVHVVQVVQEHPGPLAM